MPPTSRSFHPARECAVSPAQTQPKSTSTNQRTLCKLQVELLLASPLRRALQTCQLTFAPAIASKNLRIIALPYAEEASDAPCDTGSEPELLKTEFTEHVDFDNVKHGWWVHEGEYAFEPTALIARAAKLRRWIKARPEKEVVLVA